MHCHYIREPVMSHHCHGVLLTSSVSWMCVERIILANMSTNDDLHKFSLTDKSTRCQILRLQKRNGVYYTDVVLVEFIWTNLTFICKILILFLSVLPRPSPPLHPNLHLVILQYTLQIQYWYLCPSSLTGSLSLGPSPWRWEPVPQIQSLGNRRHQHHHHHHPQ